MPRRTIGIAGIALTSLAMCVSCAGCGGGSKRSTANSAAAGALSTTTSQTPSQTSTTSSAEKKKHAKSAQKKHSGTTTKSGSPTTTSTTTHHSPTKAGSGGSSASSSSHKSAPPPAPTVPPLPGPTVSGASGALHASLHADNHAPTAAKLWYYSVRAVDVSGHALSGTVDTEFVFSGQVVGHESPPTQPLKHGLVNRDSVTYPARAIGIPLTFRVVVHTPVGTVTLNWFVKTKR